MIKWDSDNIVFVNGELHTPVTPEKETNDWRKRIEPWLSAVFQSEHLSLLLGNGFTTGVAKYAGGTPTSMEGSVFEGCPYQDKVMAHAKKDGRKSGKR